MKTYKLWLVATAIFGTLASVTATASPWPFPWAKDCPLDWDNMAGRYMMADNARREQVDLVISVVDRRGMRLVKVTQLTAKGELIAEGRAVLREEQNAIAMYLVPAKKGKPTTYAVIKLYYKSDAQYCEDKNIVPILTLETPDDDSVKTNQYRLIKADRMKKADI